MNQKQLNIPPWSAFKFRDYRFLWISSMLGGLTMQIRVITSGFWLYEFTGSGLQLGILGIIQLTAEIPAILYGGVLADFLQRKKLISLTQSFSLIVLSVLTILSFKNILVPWHIYLTTGILSITLVLGNPARSALTANVVPRKFLLHAVTTNTATMQASSILAPIAFGLLVINLSIPYAFLLATLISIPATLTPLLIKTNTDVHQNNKKIMPLKNIVSGFKYVKAHPILPGLYFLDFGVTIFSFYRQIIPLLAKKLFSGGAGAVTILTASNSLGGIFGSFFVLFTSKIKSKGIVVLYATLFYGILLIFFGLASSLIIGTIIIALLGASDAVGMTTRQSIVQLTTPNEMRGRAVSFHSVTAMTANNIGHFEVGVMSDIIGAEKTMILGGILSILVVIIIWKTFSGVSSYKYSD